MMKYLHKILLGFSLFGAVFASADSENMDYLRLGVGGLYGLYKVDKQDKDINNIAGYLTLVGRDTFADRRVFAEVGGELFGLGMSKVKGGSKEGFYWYDADIRLGVNIASQANPLFLNVMYSFNRQYVGAVNEDFETGLHSAGLGLQGFLKGSGKTTYEYSAGYYYIFHGYHYLDKTRSGINDYSYIVKAHIGFSYEITPKIGYFMNLKAKYYNLAQSNFNTPTFNRPKTQHLIGGVELGLQF